MLTMRTWSRRGHRAGGPRRSTALVAAVALGLGSLVAMQPATAADGAVHDSWATVPEPQYYSFAVPDSVVQDEVGAEPAMVAVVGNFGPSRSMVKLNMGRSGASWTGTIGPLEPGLYYYEYEATIASTEQEVGFRNPDSAQAVTAKPSYNTFFVPGAEVAWMADVPGGGQLQSIRYDSTVAQAERSAQVWTPPGYDASRAEPYPVLYLLQDRNQSHREWTELGRAAQILDNLALQGELEPMVVVMGDSDSAEPRTEILDNILPATRAAFHVSADPADQAIAGIGRGATHALNLLLTDAAEFSHVGSFSGSLISSISTAQARQINDTTDLLRLYVGNTTDPSYNQNVSLVTKLRTAGVDFQLDDANPDSGATWESWQENLHDFASRLFRDVADDGPSDGHLLLDGPHTPPPAGTTPTPWVDEDGIVTFETGMDFADAQNITIWGNWGPGGSWPRVPMKQQGDRWRATLGPLEPGFYYYKFVVDRVDHKDSTNPTTVTSEPMWSSFTVEGDTRRGQFLNDVPEGRGGDVTPFTYVSTVTEQQRSAYVWTPPGYDADRAEAYPVFYLQHGGGQSWTDWIEMGRAAQILDNHYVRGDLLPMVVVMPDGNGVNYSAELMESLVPAIEQSYNVSSDPKQRALAGLSAGGGHVQTVLGSDPGAFAYIGIFSSSAALPDLDVEAINAGTRLLRLEVGDFTDHANMPMLNKVAQLRALGVNFEFAGETTGPHGWNIWHEHLIDFVPRLFTADSEGIPVEAEIPEGQAGVLALTVADYGEGVRLSTAENQGDRLRLTGTLPAITVTDSRSAQQAGFGGWKVSGLADAFTSGTRILSADHLGWAPRVTTPREGLTIGPAVPTTLSAGPGLRVPATLAAATREGRTGSATLGADLVLEVPVDTRPGTYTSSVTISLFPVD